MRVIGDRNRKLLLKPGASRSIKEKLSDKDRAQTNLNKEKKSRAPRSTAQRRFSEFYP